MWLRRLVGIMMVIAFLVMNGLTVYGLVAPKKELKSAIQSSALSDGATTPAPTIVLSADPTNIPAGASSSLKWTTTGDPKCVASSTVTGPWSGEKTQVGAESTGRLSTEGNFDFTLKCTNSGGVASATETITVGKALPPAKSSVSSSTPTASGKIYCGGGSPCYGPKDVAAHGSKGNCWGWNGDTVYNISSLETGYHKTKSGVSSIEVSQVCGKDLGPALSGQVSGGGGEKPRNHLSTTKSNVNSNIESFKVGYFDASK